MLPVARWGRLGNGPQTIVRRRPFAMSGDRRWGHRLGQAMASPSAPSGGTH
jgi:hypothetical protein